MDIINYIIDLHAICLNHGHVFVVSGAVTIASYIRVRGLEIAVYHPPIINLESVGVQASSVLWDRSSMFVDIRMLIDSLCSPRDGVYMLWCHCNARLRDTATPPDTKGSRGSQPKLLDCNPWSCATKVLLESFWHSQSTLWQAVPINLTTLRSKWVQESSRIAKITTSFRTKRRHRNVFQNRWDYLVL